MSLIAGTVSGFAGLAIQIKMYLLQVQAPISEVAPPSKYMQLYAYWDATSIAQYTCSCITNVLMSGLIAFRIWKVTRNIGKRKNQYLRVAWLVLETGFMYSVCLVIIATLSGFQSSTSTFVPLPIVLAYEILGTASSQLGIFPTVIILLVALRKTSDQTAEYNRTTTHDIGRQSQVGSIRFATPACAHANNAAGGTYTIELRTPQ
ncbi:hypothetical protein NEOLEDRAFT_444867 [Neolentinus lepideus HHB14362 ss-1]|uniref:Uncharacterized protein n=1 Tax=Neolentinus lepideus HHB14362 ss-1 TaxID=1314782 RepID=A0A165RRS4_9AGAM|nr:hypothetical protein NEOLEDRAFT_444867 [Neolentinus lepideus HHB14362 ss-1]